MDIPERLSACPERAVGESVISERTVRRQANRSFEAYEVHPTGIRLSGDIFR